MKQETLKNGLAGPAASVSGGVAAWLDQIDLSTRSTRGQTMRLKTMVYMSTQGDLTIIISWADADYAQDLQAQWPLVTQEKNFVSTFSDE
jgi:hypothetical protein